jgi:DNA-binding response OmpR family regulator
MVLVVDDDADLREMLDVVFSRAGVRTVSAASLAGVRALGDELSKVEVAIIDVNLGLNQPSGVEVATWLRAQGYHPRVVFITGHAPNHPLVIAAAGEGGTVLEKPFPTRRLLELVRTK